MAVTKQVYTVSPTWTAAQLATAFESAFIDAGLMTAWYDSFSSGSVENRILEIDYGTGTYEKTYYWFMFTTTGIFHGLATGWDAGTHVPTGTQYQDYFNTTTNATTDLQPMWTGNYGSLTLTTSTTFTLTRFSSGVTSGFSWFRAQHGSSFRNFHIPRPGAPIQSWIDLSKTLFHHFLVCHTTAESQGAAHRFYDTGMLRRSYVRGAGAWGTSNIFFNLTYFCLMRYDVVGNLESSGGLTNSLPTVNTNIPTTHLPFGNASVNPAYSSDYNPVFTGLPYSPYINEGFPSDFGIGQIHNSATTVAIGDQIIVTNGVEHWEYITIGGGNDARNNQSGLVARVI